MIKFGLRQGELKLTAQKIMLAVITLSWPIKLAYTSKRLLFLRCHFQLIVSSFIRSDGTDKILMLCFFRWEKAAFKWNDKNLLIKDENILSGGFFLCVSSTYSKKLWKNFASKICESTKQTKNRKNVNYIKNNQIWILWKQVQFSKVFRWTNYL